MYSIRLSLHGRKWIVRRLLSGISFSVAMLMLSNPVQAAFHLWNIREIYTDSSGTLQFIELFTSSSSQDFVGGQQILVSNVGGTVTHTFTIPSNTPGGTANHALLFGTAGLQAAGGPTPDYVIPNNFLFANGGTISFFGANPGSYTALPTDGVMSRNWGDGNAVNTPQNFAGNVGVVVPEPATFGLFGLAGLAVFWMLRRRTA